VDVTEEDLVVVPFTINAEEKIGKVAVVVNKEPVFIQMNGIHNV